MNRDQLSGPALGDFAALQSTTLFKMLRHRKWLCKSTKQNICTDKQEGIIQDSLSNTLYTVFIQHIPALLSFSGQCYPDLCKRHQLKIQGEGFSGDSVVRNLPASVGDLGLIPGLGGSHMPWSS